MGRIVTALIVTLEVIFALGLIGSFFVLILSSIEDIKVLFPEKKSAERLAPSHADIAHPELTHAELEHSRV